MNENSGSKEKTIFLNTAIHLSLSGKPGPISGCSDCSRHQSCYIFPHLHSQLFWPFWGTFSSGQVVFGWNLPSSISTDICRVLLKLHRQVRDPAFHASWFWRRRSKYLLVCVWRDFFQPSSNPLLAFPPWTGQRWLDLPEVSFPNQDQPWKRNGEGKTLVPAMTSLTHTFDILEGARSRFLQVNSGKALLHSGDGTVKFKIWKEEILYTRASDEAKKVFSGMDIWIVSNDWYWGKQISNQGSSYSDQWKQIVIGFSAHKSILCPDDHPQSCF